MCGIAGIVQSDPIGRAEESSLREMLRRLAHRGPDGEGAQRLSGAAIGHRRLAIIDLETGGQPVQNEDASVWAIVNGEIYNFLELRDRLCSRGHRFRTAGDAECLVHLYEEYGNACLDHINGMFALAIWDDARGRLLLARDRLGVKPLYYHLESVMGSGHGTRRIVFASELTALVAPLAERPAPSPTAVLDFLTFGFIPSPGTILKDVHKLPPGHLLTFEPGRAGGGVQTGRYWDLRFRGYHDGSPDEIAERVWSDLKAATRRRMLADVPIGAFLSGGLDSGAVVAAMAGFSRDPVATFTCGFSDEGFDERGPALATASLLGTQHNVCPPWSDEPIMPRGPDSVDALAGHFDEPFADASAVPTYHLARFARRFVKVALSGDGGDEVLAGYRRYRFDRAEHTVRRLLPRLLRRPLFGALAAAYPQPKWLPRMFRARATLRNLAEDGATAHGLSVATLHPADARSLLTADLARETGGYDPLEIAREWYNRCDAPDHLSRCQYVDIHLGLADGMLVKVDRASMACGLEVRSPMLDYRFVETAWRIPPRMRIERGRGKAPLRRAVGRHVGAALARREKRGFEVPLDAWLRGPLRSRVEDGPLARGASVHELISAEAIRSLWSLHVGGAVPSGQRETPALGPVAPTLWKILMLDAWLRALPTVGARAATTRQSAVAVAGSMSDVLVR